jgi:glycine/D-amino acid oxidase-like deaminating enzyme
MADTECAIIGGGIAGASVAYHLAQRGVDDVVLFERGEVASETTQKSFAMFGTYGDQTQFGLKRHALSVYNQLAREYPGITYDRIGHLSVGSTQETRQKFQRAIAEGTDVGGIFATGSDRTAVQYLDGDEIEERLFFPQVDTAEVTGAVYRPGVGYFDQIALVEALLEQAKEAGVEVREQATVDDIHVEDGAVSGLTVDGERIDAESIVIAAGPWTPDVAEKAGIDLPVRHSPAPVLVVDPEGTNGTLPSLKHHESNYNVRGNAADGTVWIGNHSDGYGEGERLDPDAVPSSVSNEVRQGAREMLERFLPSLADAPVVDEWVGVRSLTPDGNPIAGWTAVDGLSVIAFNTSGIQLSPGIADVIATQLVDGAPTDYYNSLSISRFGEYQDGH